jgi:hypothetical protein
MAHTVLLRIVLQYKQNMTVSTRLYETSEVSNFAIYILL